MDAGKYNAPPESKGAPTWALVSTMHLLNVREHLHGHWKVQCTSWKQGAPTWSLVSTKHLQKAGGT